MIALTVTNVTAPDGETYIVAVIRDVTAQKDAEEALLRSNQAMQDFVATASHELRTPLACVIGFARTLQDHDFQPSDAQRADFVEGIARNGERAARLVDDLLTVSKIQSQIMETRRDLVDVATAVEEATSSCGVDADIEVEDGLAVFADDDHVRRIVMNLLTNAEKYGHPPVRVVAARRETAVEIRVFDAGDGVPAEFRARLFDRFTRGTKHHDIEGSGLGLSIVQGLAHANGGEASYEHDDDRWCFAVRLPGHGA